MNNLIESLETNYQQSKSLQNSIQRTKSIEKVKAYQTPAKKT